MRANPKQADLAWTSEGDLMISEGMMVDTKNQAAMHLYQSVRERISCASGDWLYFPQIGTKTSRLIGRPIDERLFEDVKQSISDSLTRDGFLLYTDFTLNGTLDGNRGINLTLNISTNKLDSRMTVKFKYDLKRNRITFRRV